VYVKQFTSDPRAREKPCLRCGTSLRKNLDDKYCPQCGLSVWLSLNPNDTLEWSNPPWLRKSAKGATILAIAQPLAFVAYLLVALGAFVSAFTADPDFAIDSGLHDAELATASTQPAEMARLTQQWQEAYANATSIPVAIGIVAAGVYFLINAAGLVLLTSHEERYPDRMKTVRHGSRIVAGASALLGLALIMVGVPRLTSGWRLYGPGSSLLLFIAELAFAACACCAWLWLRRIAQRAGKPFLSKLCGYLLFLPVLPFLKAAPFLGLYFLTFLIVPLLYVLPVLYIPLSVYLLIRFALLMSRAAPEAEKSWASETKPEGWVPPAPAPPPQFTS
jgi:hypothetical protein